MADKYDIPFEAVDVSIHELVTYTELFNELLSRLYLFGSVIVDSVIVDSSCVRVQLMDVDVYNGEGQDLKEFLGRTNLFVNETDKLFFDIPASFVCAMAHASGDNIVSADYFIDYISYQFFSQCGNKNIKIRKNKTIKLKKETCHE